MPGITQHFKKGMIKDLYGYAMETYDPLSEIAPLIMAEKTVDGGYWKENTVVNSGTWRKTSESEGFQPEQPTEGYEVMARIFDYTQAVAFSYNTVRDHQKMTNLTKEIANGWGETAVETREEFYARPFNKGGLTAGDWIFNGTPESQTESDSSGNLCYDSVEFFNLSNNTRSSKGGGTYYNAEANALNVDNLKTALILMKGTNNRRENDTRMSLKPDTILTPVDLTFTGNEILGSDQEAYVTTNTVNVLKNKLKVIEWAYLTDTNAWFLGQAKKGIVMLKRMAPVINFFEDQKNRCYWATAEMRIGFMMKNWRFWYGSNVSAT